MSYQDVLLGTIKLLYSAASAVAPIHGVSIPDLYNKQTWRIDFDETATAEERYAATAVIGGIDPDVDAPGVLRIEYNVNVYSVKAAIREAQAENDTEAVADLQAKLSELTT